MNIEGAIRIDPPLFNDNCAASPRPQKERTNMKSTSILLLTLTLLLCLLPVGAMAVTGDYTMDFTATSGAEAWAGVASPATTNCSGAGWTWDATAKKLTLTDFTFETTASTAVQLPDSTLVLNGTNRLKSGDGESSNCIALEDVDFNLTIEGAGSLTATAGDATIEHGISHGFWGNVTVNNGTVTIKSGLANAKDAGSHGIYGSLTVNNGTVTVTGGDAGLDADITISSGVQKNVTVNGGTVTVMGGENRSLGSSGVNGEITVNGGSLYVSGTDCAKGSIKSPFPNAIVTGSNYYNADRSNLVSVMHRSSNYYAAGYGTPVRTLYIESTVTAKPLIRPVGSTYSSVQTISIISPTAGAAVYYTTDNSDPTTLSTLYIAPFTLSRSATVKAKAFSILLSESPVAAETYTLKTATPVISPKGGSYSSAQTIRITCATAGAAVYYTTDGSEPTTGSTLYTAPFTLKSSATVRAKAFFGDLEECEIATEVYIINIIAGTNVPQTGDGAAPELWAGLSLLALAGLAWALLRRRAKA